MPDSAIPQTCTHERRPGTTTCLYCLQEARARTSARRRRALGRFGLAFLGGALAIALVVFGITKIAPASGSVAIAPDSPAVDQSGDAGRTPARPERSARRAPAAARPSEPALLPVIERGTRDLGEGIIATRAGAEVVVTFDTDLLRTRFDWKFEGVVRSTLPRVFGDPAREALDSIPTGRLVQGDLLEELPERGIPLVLPGFAGDTLMVWPLTRQGRDGPIVVAYRAAAR